MLLAADGELLAAQAPPCALPRPDTYRLADPPIYRACDVTQPARLGGELPRLNFRPSNQAMAARAGCLRAEFAFVVNHDGAVDTATVALVETNYPEYGQAVRATLARLKYEPAELDGVPVRQAVSHVQEGRLTGPGGRVAFAVGRVGAPPPPASAAPSLSLGPCG